MIALNTKRKGQRIGSGPAKGIFKVYKEKGVTAVFTSVHRHSTDLLSFFNTLGFDRSNFINLRKTPD